MREIQSMPGAWKFRSSFNQYAVIQAPQFETEDSDQISLFRNYFTIALRRNKTYSLINILGLALGIASCILAGSQKQIGACVRVMASSTRTIESLTNGVLITIT